MSKVIISVIGRKPKPKRKTVVIRGVPMSVPSGMAEELKREETKALRKEWETNNLID